MLRTVTNGEHTAGLLQVDSGGGGQDSLLQDGGNLSGSSLGGLNLGGGGQLAGSHGDGGNLDITVISIGLLTKYCQVVARLSITITAYEI